MIGILFVMVLSLFVVTYLLYTTNFSLDGTTHATHFPGSAKAQLKRDCGLEAVYSVGDDQCSSVCKGPGLFVSRDGVCVDSTTLTQTKVHNHCSPKHGVLAYFVGNPELGTVSLKCLSTDPGVQPDDGDIEKNQLCIGGDITIDYVKGNPQLKDCKCKEGEFLALISNTSEIRYRGFCATESSRPLYEFNALTYDHRRDV